MKARLNRRRLIPTFTDTGELIHQLIQAYRLRDPQHRAALDELAVALKAAGNRELSAYLAEELHVPVDVARRLLRALRRVQEEIHHI